MLSQNNSQQENYDLINLKVMCFLNNVLRGYAHKNPTQFLTEDQLSWYQQLKQYQQSVVIYVDKRYKDKLTPEKLDLYARIGMPNFESYFDQFEHGNPKKQKDGNRKLFKQEFHKNFKSDDFQRILSKSEVKHLKQYIAPEHDEGSTEKDRQYNKYRVIYSSVPCVHTDGTLYAANILTACAPNLMGSSPEDLKTYSSNGVLNQPAYKETDSDLSKLIIFAMHDTQAPSLYSANFGVGVYINKLTKAEQNKAREIMYAAFAHSASVASEQLQFSGQVKWVIYNQDPNAKNIVATLNNGPFKNQKHIQSIEGDIIRDISMWVAQEPNAIILNNGSDRTLCGAMCSFKPDTTEEKLAQAILIALVQTIFNPYLLDNIVYVDLKTFKKENVSKTTLAKPDVSYENKKQESEANPVNESKKEMESNPGSENEEESKVPSGHENSEDQREQADNNNQSSAWWNQPTGSGAWWNQSESNTSPKPAKIKLGVGKDGEFKNRYVQCIFNDENAAKRFVKYLASIHIKDKAINKQEEEGHQLYVVRLNRDQFNHYKNDKKAYNHLLYKNFISTNKLDFTDSTHIQHWQEQVKFGGGQEIVLNHSANDKVKVPTSIALIKPVIEDSSLSEMQKISEIVRRLKAHAEESSGLFSLVSTIVRTELTANLIKEGSALLEQFKENQQATNSKRF